MSKAGSIITDEINQKGGHPAPARVKMFSLLTRKPGNEVATFQTYWRTHHGRWPRKSRKCRRYVQCTCGHPHMMTVTRRAYDGVAELWFDNFRPRYGILATPISYRAVKIDEPKFPRAAFPFTSHPNTES